MGKLKFIKTEKYTENKVNFMTKRQHYVCGFLFSPDMTEVVLVEKNRPSWQAGKLNGIGGSIEEGEQSLDAMIREFKEETGLFISHWEEFAILENDEWIVDVYSASAAIYKNAKTTTDEIVHILKVADLHKYKVIDNLKWLIPMCLDKGHVHTISSAVNIAA